MSDGSANAIAVNPIAPPPALGSMVAWRFGPTGMDDNMGRLASYERRN